MKTKTNIKAGYGVSQHNETLVRPQVEQGRAVKTHIRGGLSTTNHNETLVRV